MNRMKKAQTPFFLFVLLFMCISFSCKDDDATSQKQTFQEGDAFTLDEVAIQRIFPLEEYQNNSAIVFKNETGLEYRFPIVLTENSISCPNDSECAGLNLNYTADIIRVELLAEGFPNYGVNFSLEPVINGEEFTYDYCVLINVLEFNRVIIEQMPPLPFLEFTQIIGCLDTYEPSNVDMDFLGTTFEDVVQGFFIPASHDGLSKVYYTPEQGLAAFEDEFNELYIFDRFE